jgi:amino acid transporter
MVPSGFLFWGTVVFGVAQCREYSISLNMAELMTTELEIVTLFPLDGSFIRLAGRYVISSCRDSCATASNTFQICRPRSGCSRWVESFCEQKLSAHLIAKFAQTSYVVFEATVINTLVEYWGYNQSPAILITVSLVLYFSINIYRADLFGEAECECYYSYSRIGLTLSSLAGAWQSVAGHRDDRLHLCHHGRW